MVGVDCWTVWQVLHMIESTVVCSFCESYVNAVVILCFFCQAFRLVFKPLSVVVCVSSPLQCDTLWHTGTLTGTYMAIVKCGLTIKVEVCAGVPVKLACIPLMFLLDFLQLLPSTTYMTPTHTYHSSATGSSEVMCTICGTCCWEPGTSCSF